MKGNVFRIAKHLVNRNRDIVGASCVKDSIEKIIVKEVRLMEIWRAHYDKIYLMRSSLGIKRV